MNKRLQSYFDVGYTLRFVIVLGAFYYFHILYLGITTPGGSYYSEFLDEKLNYIEWLTASIANTSSLCSKLAGLTSFVEQTNTVRTADGSSVQIWLPCLGLSIMGVWVAYVLNRKTKWTVKLHWILLGLFGIWCINCLRVSILLVALDRNWPINRFLDHHDLFNIAGYLLILVMAFLYHKQPEKT